MREPREPRLTRPTPQQGSGREAAFGRPARPARQEPDLFDLFPGRNDPQGWEAEAYPPQPAGYPGQQQAPAGRAPYAYSSEPAHHGGEPGPLEDGYPDPFGRTPQPQHRPAAAPPRPVPPAARPALAYGVGRVSAVDPDDPFHPVPVSTDPASAGWQQDPDWDDPVSTPFGTHSGLDTVTDLRREPVMMPEESRRPSPARPDPSGSLRPEPGYDALGEAGWPPSRTAAAAPEPDRHAPDRYAVEDEDRFFAAEQPQMAAPPREPLMRREPPRREPPATPAEDGGGSMLSGLRLKNVDPRKPRMASPFPITGLPETPQQRSKLMLWVAVAAGVIVVGGAGWFLMNGRSGPDGQLGAPTIMADPSPYKVRPADPGGMQVANQDKMVYERISPDEAQQPGVEKLLPEPTVPRAPEVSEPQRLSQAVIPAGPQAMETASAPVPVIPPVPTAAAPGGTVAVGQVAAPPMVASPPAPVPATPPPSFSSPQPAGADAPRGPAVLGPPVTGPAPAVPATPQQAAAPIAPPAAAPVTRSAATGSFSVQLAALRDEVSVRKQWDSLKTKYPDLLGPYSMGIEKADLGEKGVFYRLRATGLPTEESARVLCTELAKQKVGCLFVGK